MRFTRLWMIATLLLASCASVKVTDAGTGLRAAPKPKGCAVPIFRTKAPERPYDEVATLHYTNAMNGAGDPVSAEGAIREKACELGADALIVTREFVPGVGGMSGSTPMMSATAILYRPAGAASSATSP